MTYQFNIGDKVNFDSNYHGVTPRINSGTIIGLDRTMATHGYPACPAYEIEYENGFIGNICEYQIEK
jgi:hypothetical protein